MMHIHDHLWSYSGKALSDAWAGLDHMSEVLGWSCLKNEKAPVTRWAFPVTKMAISRQIYSRKHFWLRHFKALGEIYNFWKTKIPWYIDHEPRRARNTLIYWPRTPKGPTYMIYNILIYNMTYYILHIEYCLLFIMYYIAHIIYYIIYM